MTTIILSKAETFHVVIPVAFGLVCKEMKELKGYPIHVNTKGIAYPYIDHLTRKPWPYPEAILPKDMKFSTTGLS